MPPHRRCVTVGPVNALHLDLEGPVHCSGTHAGKLADVILEPDDGIVTHVVVRLEQEVLGARMIPLALVVKDDEDGLALGCTVAELREFEPMQQFAYLPAGEQPQVGPDRDVGVRTVIVAPTYDAAGIGLYVTGEPNIGITYDPVPKGEVELRRASNVTSADDHRLGHVGQIDVAADGRVEALVIDHRSLWHHRHTRVSLADVERLETDEVRLALSKAQVAALHPQ